MTSNQRRIFKLLKRPMSAEKAFQLSEFRNRHHFNMILNDMLNQGILETCRHDTKKADVVETQTYFNRSKDYSLTKLVAGSVGMFVWFFIVPTVVFIIGE